MGKKVSAWGFVKKKEVAAAILPQFRILCKKDVDFYGKPVVSHLRELEAMEFDLLIDLSLRPVIPLEYLTLCSNAKFKCSSPEHRSEDVRFYIGFGKDKIIRG